MNIVATWNDTYRQWWAIDEDTYDGAEDAGPRARCVGVGPTADAAIADLKRKLADLE
jgi:hypothetical protein